jgi:hypothetical protein
VCLDFRSRLRIIDLDWVRVRALILAGWSTLGFFVVTRAPGFKAERQAELSFGLPQFIRNVSRYFSDRPNPRAMVFTMVPLASSSLRAQTYAPPRPPGTLRLT